MSAVVLLVFGPVAERVCPPRVQGKPGAGEETHVWPVPPGGPRCAWRRHADGRERVSAKGLDGCRRLERSVLTSHRGGVFRQPPAGVTAPGNWACGVASARASRSQAPGARLPGRRRPPSPRRGFQTALLASSLPASRRQRRFRCRAVCWENKRFGASKVWDSPARDGAVCKDYFPSREAKHRWGSQEPYCGALRGRDLRAEAQGGGPARRGGPGLAGFGGRLGSCLSGDRREEGGCGGPRSTLTGTHPVSDETVTQGRL